MTTTYQMIKALPAKGFNWTGFTAALRSKVIAANAAMPHTLEGWDGAKGMREVRTAAMEMAAFYVSRVSSRSHIIPPSDESRVWDSFEGGHHCHWTDRDADEAATNEIAQLIKTV